MPRVSVIIAAYNCQNSIEKAINSIMIQTFTDWECIICEDGSTDNTWNKINEVVKSNPQFILLKNRRNLGIAVTLNRCINMSSGEYLAIQDGDDFSERNRLQEQVLFLETHKDVSVVGSYAFLFDKNGRRWGELKPALLPDKKDWVKGFFIIHASTLMRRGDVLDSEVYNEKLSRVQDYDLWLNLIRKSYKIVTIPKLLYNVRWDIADYSRRSLKYRFIEAKIISQGIKFLKLPPFHYLYIIKTVISGILHPRILHLYYLYKFTQRKQNLLQEISRDESGK